MIGDALRAVAKVVIPELHSRFGMYEDNEVVCYLKSLEIKNLQYTKLNNNWSEGRQGLKSYLYTKSHYKR